MEQRQILVYGSLPEPNLHNLEEGAEQASCQLHFVASPRDAARWLDDHEAHGLLLDMQAPEAEQVALQARATARLAQLPILAATSSVDDLAFAEAFTWGADDVLRLDKQWQLTARLRALPSEPPPAPSRRAAGVIVADMDQSRRIVLGRVLRNAGYTVTFAVTRDDVVQFAQMPGQELVVLGPEIEGVPAELIDHSRRAGSNVTFIVARASRELKTMRSEIGQLPGVSVMDGYSPAENVLFLANELRNGGRVQNQRASARLLFGTRVYFRGAGRDEDDVGYCYNLSEGGLYVRTLAPAEDDLVWLELVPPRNERRVRLVGRIVWRRRFGFQEFATVPPGFGAQIVDGAKADLDAWAAGYSAFSEALG